MRFARKCAVYHKKRGVQMAQYLHDFWQTLLRMQWSDYLDILIVAVLIYKLFPLIKGSSITRIAKFMVLVLIVAWLADALDLHTFSFIINSFLEIGIIALIILYQPELRRMLDHLSNVKLKSFLGVTEPVQEMVPVINQVVMACEVMSRERVGALIVFARDNRLEEYFKTGTRIDGQVTDQLVRNIFFPKASLHDGAMIIRDGRVAAAGCVLPLSDSDRINADLGTRHRAGVGMSEVSDAVVVIVSEETGTISVAVGGMLKRHLAAQTLERLLRNELCPEEPGKQENLVLRLRQRLKKGGDRK